MSLYRIKCIIEYDGYDYMGFQVQGNAKTIELAVKNAIFMMTGDSVKIYPSGRTDRYVHARGQVFHFDTDKKISSFGWVSGINSFLPNDIRIISADEVDMNFHARFSAKKKEYRYYICFENYNVFRRRYFAYYKDLDFNLMNEAIKHFVGTFNFKSFCSASVDPRKDFVKTIYEAKIIKHNEFYEFIFIGNGFLKYQIRRMMGIIIEIGKRNLSVEKIDEILELKDPSISHKIAPGNGLYLEKVYY